MKPTDYITILATSLGAIVSCYLGFLSGDYAMPIVVGVALPVIVCVINRFSGNKKILTASFVAALVAGFALIGVTLLVRRMENTSLDTALNKVASGNQNLLDRKLDPPLPMLVKNKLYYANHLLAFPVKDLTIAFLAAPAGAGKSVLLKQLVRSSNEVTRSGTVYLPLSSFKEKAVESRQPDTYGTQRGLGRVLALDTSDSEGVGLFTVICSCQFRNVSEEIAKTWPFSLRSLDANKRRFTDACRDRLERETKTTNGLRIFIDDLDEIEETSLLQLITLIEREIKTRNGNILLLLAGRPEVLYTISKERRLLWAERNNSNKGVSLVTGTIERMTPSMEVFEDYKKKVVEFELSDENDEMRKSVLEAINLQLPLSKNLQEALQYLDGCGFAVQHFLKLKKENLTYNDIVFGRDFYQCWRNRAYEKQRLPSFDKTTEYEEALKKAAGVIARDSGKSNLQLGLRVLLYSGLVDVIPVHFGSKLYEVKFQFPQFLSAILRPPWEEEKQLPIRRQKEK